MCIVIANMSLNIFSKYAFSKFLIIESTKHSAYATFSI